MAESGGRTPTRSPRRRSRSHSVGRWRKELAPEAAEIINRELGPEIGAVGYEV
jgi:hypothetical protein